MNFEVWISDSFIFLIKNNIILGLYVDEILIIGEKEDVDDFMMSFVIYFHEGPIKQLMSLEDVSMTWESSGNEVIFHQMGMMNKLEVNVMDLIKEWKVRDSSTWLLSGTGIENKGYMRCIWMNNFNISTDPFVGTLLYLTKHSITYLCNSIKYLCNIHVNGCSRTKCLVWDLKPWIMFLIIGFYMNIVLIFFQIVITLGKLFLIGYIFCVEMKLVHFKTKKGIKY